ncbi:MAG: hypothetical protein D6769_01840, partial [Methanobacteriota archaeon]
SLSNIVRNAGLYALYNVANHTTYYPARSEEDAKAAIYEVFLYGYTPPTRFYDGPGGNAREIDVSTNKAYLYALIANINDSLKQSGLKITKFSVPDAQLPGWSISLKDYKTVLLNTSLNITVVDENGVGSINLHFPLSVELPLEGIPDPLVNRKLVERGDAPTRLLYFDSREEFPQLSSPAISVEKSSTGLQYGQGWAYGFVLNKTDIGTTFLLHGKFNNIRGKSAASGYIVNGTSSTNSISCGTDTRDNEVNTFNALTYFDDSGTCRRSLSNALYAPIDSNNDGSKDGKGQMFALLHTDAFNNLIESIDGKPYLAEVVDGDGLVVGAPESIYSPPHSANIKKSASKLLLYNIEEQRRAAISGYYYRWNSSYRSSPPQNFFQRMTNDSSLSDDKNGVFSFLITGEFKEADNAVSRVDYEWVAGQSSNLVVVRGFSGCKDPYMCSLDPRDYDVGRFAMSESIARDLNLDSIACSWSNAMEGCYG